MEKRPASKNGITAQKAKEILSRRGIVVSEKKADEILEIMYFLAKLIVDQNFKK